MELILVMVVLGILSVSATAIFSGTAEYRLDGTARKIASDIRYAQELAMDTRGTYTLKFFVEENCYTLFAKDSTQTPEEDPFTRGDYTIDLDEEEYGGVSLASASWGGLPFFSFNPQGVPSSGGSVVLACGGRTRTITVLAETGLVRTSGMID